MGNQTFRIRSKFVNHHECGRNSSRNRRFVDCSSQLIISSLSSLSTISFGRFLDMATSRFIGIYSSQVEQLIRTLTLISDVLKLWIVVEQKWIYLSKIFNGSNLQLTDEAKRFEFVEKFYRKILSGETTFRQLSSMSIRPVYFTNRNVEKSSSETIVSSSGSLRRIQNDFNVNRTNSKEFTRISRK